MATLSATGPGYDVPSRVFDYEVLDFIGEGAGSLIYVVSHPDTRQIYALKRVVKRTEKDARFFEQVANEFEVCRALTHPGLRRCFELRTNGTFLRKPTEAALLMEMFDGSPLDVHRRTSGRGAGGGGVSSGGGADLPGTISIFIQVARALAALHATGFVHCDLKPSNILVAPDGGQAKVIDFGQACPIHTAKERIQGTADFMAPEQVRREPVTPRTDVFCLGATLYTALTGQPIPTLFTVKRADNSFLMDDRIPAPRDYDASIPEPLSNLVMECIRTNPAKRPSDMNELARRLEVVEHVVRRRMAVA